MTDSKFQLQDCSHSLVSAKPSNVIRNLPFWYCAINCAGGEVIKLPSGIVPSFICTSSDLNIWPGGSGRSPEVVSIQIGFLSYNLAGKVATCAIEDPISERILEMTYFI